MLGPAVVHALPSYGESTGCGSNEFTRFANGNAELLHLPKFIIAKWALRDGENVTSQLVDAIPEEGDQEEAGNDGGYAHIGSETQHTDIMDGSSSSDSSNWSDTSKDETEN